MKFVGGDPPKTCSNKRVVKVKFLDNLILSKQPVVNGPESSTVCAKNKDQLVNGLESRQICEKYCPETQVKHKPEDDVLVGAWGDSKVDVGVPKSWSSSAVGNILGEYVKSDLDSNVPALDGGASAAKASYFKTNMLSPKLDRQAKVLANSLPVDLRNSPPASASGGPPIKNPRPAKVLANGLSNKMRRLSSASLSGDPQSVLL